MIDLKKLINDRNLDKKEIASLLFPDHRHPSLALNRIISGESKLDSDQISKLSSFSGVSIADMFSGKNRCLGSQRINEMTFENGDYKAILDMSNWSTKIFHKDSLFHDQVLHSISIPLREYLEMLDQLILKKEFEI